MITQITQIKASKGVICVIVFKICVIKTVEGFCNGLNF
jgi:hypothetical protein